MANLIEQMNVLRGLSDDVLKSEVNAPSGSAPPYLVLTEIQRRDAMRKRYEGEAARHKQRTTVVEDLMAAQPAAAPAMGDMGGGGITAAMGPNAGPPQAQPPGFAEGGIVDYADIARRYQEKLEGLSGSSDNARAMALLAASAGILGGDSSNTLKNLGGGLSAGLNAYQTQMQQVDKDELELLRGLSDIGQVDSQRELAEQDRAFRERQLAQDQQQFETRLGQERTPAAVAAVEWYNSPETTDAERETYDRQNPPYNPNGVSPTDRMSDDFAIARKQALENLPEDPSAVNKVRKMTPAEQAAYQIARQRQADIVAYYTIKSTMGEEKAKLFKYQAGLTDADLMGSAPAGSTGAPVLDPTADFLDIGL